MNKDIHNELNELSPLIAKLREKEENPIVDSDYWTSSEEVLMSLSKITSADQKSSNEDIPANYWSEVEAHLLSNVSQKPALKIVWFRKPKMIAIIAAVFCTVIASIFVLKNYTADSNNLSTQQFTYTEDELWQYIEQNPQEFTIEKLIDAKVIDSTLVNDLTYFEDNDDDQSILMDSEFQF
jgi:hypothetical protein